ncbi:winged-helix domain-containing protein [Asaia lannensis]|uniref:Response regulator transcription factor n=1 Tax=Asaia lannensis NBRC 102526 TaxID=1307926 RepID=A0ABT1CGN2_9PROT|nr:response regulator transcription factor [Asaia lannensis]MCO6160017.1 response regulator transcription factor [Asaia lannensis NBRC 102526]GBQ99302.1 putative two component response regulator [Asaia lannensis NBRC 102526]
MRVLCVAESSGAGRPSDELAKAAIAGSLSITASGPAGIVETLRRTHYDIVVLQQAASDTRIIRQLRKGKIAVPVIVVRKIGSAEGEVELLSAGADDCVGEETDHRVLLARLRAVARRAGGHDSPTLQVGRMSVGIDRREVHIDGAVVPLTRKEYDLLVLLVMRKNQVLSKEVLLDSLYSGEDEPFGKVIDVMICKIRKKIRAFGINEPFTTQWGIGYRLNEPAFSPMTIVLPQEELHVRTPARENCLPMTGGIHMLGSMASPGQAQS